jgi:ribosomal protein L29
MVELRNRERIPRPARLGDPVGDVGGAPLGSPPAVEGEEAVETGGRPIFVLLQCPPRTTVKMARSNYPYRVFGFGTDDPNVYCDYVRQAKEKLATEVVPRNFRVEISEGQYQQTSYPSFQYANKKLVYEGYGHTIPTFSYSLWRRGVSSFGGEAYLTMHETCPKEPTLEMFYDLCLELDVVRSQIEELVKDKVDQLRAELVKDIQSEVDELRAELAELKKAKDIQSEVDELRAELAELKKAKDIQSEVDELRAELVKDIQSEVDELRAELVELKPKQRPKGRFGLFDKQS